MIPIAKPFIGQEEIDAVVKVMKSGIIAQGFKVRELEEKFAKFCGTKYAVAVNSGTAALHTSLKVVGITSNPEMKGIPLTKKEGAIKDSIIKLNYIFTVSEAMIEKLLFSLSKEKKKMVFDGLMGRLKGVK